MMTKSNLPNFILSSFQREAGGYTIFSIHYTAYLSDELTPLSSIPEQSNSADKNLLKSINLQQLQTLFNY